MVDTNFDETRCRGGFGVNAADGAVDAASNRTPGGAGQVARVRPASTNHTLESAAVSNRSDDPAHIPPEHEREFADYLLEQSAPRTRVGMAVAASVFGMATLGDLRSMPPEVLAWSVPVRVALVIPSLLLLAWVAADRSRLRWHLPVAFAGCAISAVTITGIVVHLQLLGHGWTIHRAVLLSFGIYVLSGLRVRGPTRNSCRPNIRPRLPTASRLAKSSS